jgi:hypothetical protein
MINVNLQHSQEPTRDVGNRRRPLTKLPDTRIDRGESSEYTYKVSHFSFNETLRCVRSAMLNSDRLTYVEEEDRGDVSRLFGTGQEFGVRCLAGLAWLVSSRQESGSRH